MNDQDTWITKDEIDFLKRDPEYLGEHLGLAFIEYYLLKSEELGMNFKESCEYLSRSSKKSLPRIKRMMQDISSMPLKQISDMALALEIDVNSFIIGALMKNGESDRTDKESIT